MTRSPQAMKPRPFASVELIKLMAAFGPITVIEAFRRALESTGAETSKTQAKRNASEQVVKPSEEEEGAEEEDVIDKVVKLYDVY